MQKSEIVKVLHGFSFFKNLDDTQLTLVSASISYKEFHKGDILIEQNAQGEDVFFILTGHVKVYLLNEDGKEVNLAILGPGETIGELSILVKGPRSAYCEAIDDVSVLTLSGNDFKLLIEKNSKIALGILKYFGERIIKANLHFEEMMFLNLKERAYLLLEQLSKGNSEKTIEITQEMLATILSATRPRVTEALKDLEKSKKIKISREKIKIL